MAAPAVPGIALMGMPTTAVLCPEPNSICHNMRVLSLVEARKTLTLPQKLWNESNKK
jgi:hypothetical protein